MYDLLVLLILVWLIDRVVSKQLIVRKIRWQLSLSPIEAWAERLRRYSWANEYLSLTELEACFSSQIRDQVGRYIYVFEADFHGVPLSKGLESHQPEMCIGYYTDRKSYAKTFLYKRNRRGRLMVIANTIGAAPDQAPHKAHPLRDLPRHWQEYVTN